MYLEIFKHAEMFDLRFKRLGGNKKRMTQVVSSYTLTCKLGPIYLKAKLQQDGCRLYN